jgi:hypothetical protein
MDMGREEGTAAGTGTSARIEQALLRCEAAADTLSASGRRLRQLESVLAGAVAELDELLGTAETPGGTTGGLAGDEAGAGRG